MNRICDICSEYIEGQIICLRVSDLKTYVDFNCCNDCAQEQSKHIKNECSEMTVSKTLNHLNLKIK